ncbi:GGDEF domain-containing protein [Pseudocolwellia sp. HL-MZ19]|uniref:GGDEF domain-containing protein n=1 Tax=unclassified Pseudocolwellia TaxID=2848178 RepID=UPI003CF8E859
MNSLKSLFLAYLNAGAKKHNSDETNKKIFILHLFALIGTLITAVASGFAYSNQNFQLCLILSIVSFIFTLGPITQKYINNYTLSSSIILYQVYFLMFYLLCTGGANQTGPLWIFLTAPVTFFICGLKTGIFNLSVFIMVASSILLMPFESLAIAYYPLDFKLRLLSSFITVSALSALYEYARESSYRAMHDMSDKFEKLSKIDPLTQLSNRRDATHVIEYEQRRLIRNQTELSIIICDVDNFKRINDEYGHNIGDVVLVELAKIFKSCVRTQDTIARWGGEEFLFILPYTTSIQAGITAKKIHKAIKDKYPLSNEHTFDVTVSMGISTMVDDKNIQTAISEADKNLYKAKNSGKNKTFTNDAEILPD